MLSTFLICAGYSFVAVEVKPRNTTKHVNIRSLGKPVSFLFPRVLMFPSGSDIIHLMSDPEGNS